MKRIHIVGPPRSGTTLMLELLVNGFRVDGYWARETCVLRPPPREHGIYCSKMPGDTHLAGPLLEGDPEQWIIFMLRDPRDVVVSRHGLAPDRYVANLMQWRRAWGDIAPWRDHERLVVVRYEELVRSPDSVQKEVSRRMPFLEFKAPFSGHHLTARPSQSLEAMRALRQVEDSSIGAWRREKARLAGQMRIHGDLCAELIALGYENDDRWAGELAAVEPDLRPGFWPEEMPPGLVARRRAEATDGVTSYLRRRGLIPPAARPAVHIVCALSTVHGGTEQAVLALYQGLEGRSIVQLWSEGEPDPRIDAPVRRIDERAGEQPVGGTLVIAGNFLNPGTWLERTWPERVILLYNTTVRPDLKYPLIDRLRGLGDPEIVYESRLIRDWVAIPGAVFPSLIDLDRFVPAPRAPDGRFVVGRLSRDVPEKHHPSDPALYRRLAAQDVSVRIMGGTCLSEALAGEPRIALLPAGAEPAPGFLQGLDCFLYRTSPSWTEAGGRVVAEAMACGLPVVCHRLGGYAEWIEDGVSGFLFDRDEQAEAIVLRLKSDPALRLRIGQAARRRMEAEYSPSAKEALRRHILEAPPRRCGPRRRIDFAWELGGHTGHVTTLLPIARAMQARGYPVRFLLRDPRTGADLEGMTSLPREPAPHWVGPLRFENPLNFGEILINFGYEDPVALRQLVEAWRDRLADTALVVANVAPAAHIAARTLGIPSLEISQGFHNPPPTLPSPPLRDWEPAPRARLEQADRSVLAAVNSVLGAYAVPPLSAIGELFSGRSMLLTYPELDVYPERGPAEYFGIPESGEGSARPPWPQGRGARVFGYLYSYCPGLERLLDALVRLGFPTLVLCRGVEERLRAKYAGGPVHLAAEPMAASSLLPESDLVICHGSHQMTAQALLAGKPVLAVPTQLEQFLTTRRVVRFGAGLGVMPEVPDADFAAALQELWRKPGYAAKAREFAQRYARHDRDRALQTMIARCEAALDRRQA